MEQKVAEGFDFSLYKKFYDAWVRSASEMLNEAMQSPHYAAAMGKTLESSLDFKKRLDELIESSIKGLHLPSSTDILELSRRVKALEQHIQGISQKLEELKAPPPAEGSVPLPRKRPSRQRKQ